MQLHTETDTACTLVNFIRSKLSTADQENLGICDESIDADLLELSEDDIEVLCDALPVMARGRVRREWKKTRCLTSDPVAAHPKAKERHHNDVGEEERRQAQQPIPCFYTDCFAVDVEDRHRAESLGLDFENCSYISLQFNGSAYASGSGTATRVWKFLAENSDLSTASSFELTFKPLSISSDPFSHLKYKKRSMLNMSTLQKKKPATSTMLVGNGPGMHAATFNGTKFWFLQQKIGHPLATGSYSSTSTTPETLVIFVNGRGQHKTLQKFIEDVLDQTMDKKPKAKTVNVSRWSTQLGQWVRGVAKRARPMSSVFLPPSVSEAISKDLDTYLSQRAVLWYRTHGIPYKRIYLFYGTPGAGKTSFIHALAGEFSMDVCFLQPTGRSFSDETLQKALKSVPRNSIIVIEDIDALFTKNRNKADLTSALSFSGLINGLDGVANLNGQIFILTTNFIDRLDPAMIRSGRVDLRVEFPPASPEQIEAMFHAYYPTHAPFGGCDVESFLSDGEDGENGEDGERKETTKEAEDDDAERSGNSSTTEEAEDDGAERSGNSSTTEVEKDEDEKEEVAEDECEKDEDEEDKLEKEGDCKIGKSVDVVANSAKTKTAASIKEDDVEGEVKAKQKTLVDEAKANMEEPENEEKAKLKTLTDEAKANMNELGDEEKAKLKANMEEPENEEKDNLKTLTDEAKANMKEPNDEEKAKLKALGVKFAREWTHRFPRGISMATVQQHFIRHMHSTASECVANVKNAEVWERSTDSHAEMYM